MSGATLMATLLRPGPTPHEELVAALERQLENLTACGRDLLLGRLRDAVAAVFWFEKRFREQDENLRAVQARCNVLKAAERRLGYATRLDVHGWSLARCDDTWLVVSPARSNCGSGLTLDEAFKVLRRAGVEAP